MIEDLKINEYIREVIKSKLFFYKDYNLLMYFKLMIIISRVIIKKIFSFDDENEFNFNDNLLNIKNQKSSFI